MSTGELRIAVTGHRSFDAAATDYITDHVEQLLDAVTGQQRARIICSLAEGADQLVARIGVRRGLPLEVIVPAIGYAASLPESDRQGYAELLTTAVSVRTLDHEQPTPSAYLDAGMLMVAEANLLIAVWDGHRARGVGGTAQVVQRARELGVDVEVVWPPGYDRPR